MCQMSYGTHMLVIPMSITSIQSEFQMAVCLAKKEETGLHSIHTETRVYSICYYKEISIFYMRYIRTKMIYNTKSSTT